MRPLLIDLVLGRTCATLMGMAHHSAFFQLASLFQNQTSILGSNTEETSKLNTRMEVLWEQISFQLLSLIHIMILIKTLGCVSYSGLCSIWLDTILNLAQHIYIYTLLDFSAPETTTRVASMAMPQWNVARQVK